MTSPPSSDPAALSIEDMQSIMSELENGGPIDAPTTTPTLAEQVTAATAVAKITATEAVIAGGCAPAVLAPEIKPPAPTAPPKSPIEQYVSAEQLAEDVRIDPYNLDQACVEHAGKFVHYANLRSLARRQFEKMKAAFEILESRMYAEYREKLSGETVTELDAKGKEVVKTVKVTEAMVDAAVKADRRWWAGKNRLIDAQAVADLAGNAAAAFEQRRDMIVQMGSDRRIERQGELRIMGANQDAKSARERALAIVKESAERNAAAG